MIRIEQEFHNGWEPVPWVDTRTGDVSHTFTTRKEAEAALDRYLSFQEENAQDGIPFTRDEFRFVEVED